MSTIFCRLCAACASLLFGQLVGLASDGELLVCGDGIYQDLAVRSGDLVDIFSLGILFLVAGDAQISEISHYVLTDECAVLADAGCESDHVYAVHSCCVGADVLGYSVAESVYSELGILRQTERKRRTSY